MAGHSHDQSCSDCLNIQKLSTYSAFPLACTTNHKLLLIPRAVALVISGTTNATKSPAAPHDCLQMNIGLPFIVGGLTVVSRECRCADGL